MAIGEFDLIKRFFARETVNTDGTILGVGDDAAIIAPTPGMHMAVAADSMVAGRHFFPGTDPYSLGWKCLAVNLSDMAAMGARPRWFTLCLTLPDVDEAWLSGFSSGLFALADRFDIPLIGGDTTAGPLAFSIQIIGELEAGMALRRSGAQPGDDVWLTGCTGAAALAVSERYGQISLNGDDRAYCSSRLDLPEPRVIFGSALAGMATSAIDISDGLLADLGHIAAASGVQIELLQNRIPLPHVDVPQDMLNLVAMSGGDDYELAFSAPCRHRDTIVAAGQSLGVPVSRIGKVSLGEGVIVKDANETPIVFPRPGFDHFKY